MCKGNITCDEQTEAAAGSPSGKLNEIGSVANVEAASDT